MIVRTMRGNIPANRAYAWNSDTISVSLRQGYRLWNGKTMPTPNLRSHKISN